MSKPGAVKILYRDSHIVVVNKPPGVLSVPGRDPAERSVLSTLKQSFADVLPVHRLDRDTSGVMVYALDATAHRVLSARFMAREIEKIYVAIVRGAPREEVFEVDLPLIVDSRHITRVSREGKPALTYFRILERFRSYAFLEARPVTGRQHQVRVHLAAAGLPLAVDPDYGFAGPLTIHEIKPHARPGNQSSALLSRTPLHARSLRFLHPVGDEPMFFEVPMLKDMHATLNQLRKWNK